MLRLRAQKIKNLKTQPAWFLKINFFGKNRISKFRSCGSTRIEALVDKIKCNKKDHDKVVLVNPIFPTIRYFFFLESVSGGLDNLPESSGFCTENARKSEGFVGPHATLNGLT